MEILATAGLESSAVFEVEKSRAFNSDVTPPLPGCDRLGARSAEATASPAT